MSVDVVIPTWNRAELVLGALASLDGQATHHAIVVDNGSHDGTVARIRAVFPAVEVVALSENLGFGKAVNLGIEAGRGDIVVLLNNDIEALPGFIEAIAAPFVDPEMGSVAGVLLDAAGATVDAAGVVVDAGLAGYSHLHGMSVAEFDRSAGASPLGPCGGAAAYRRSALVDVGLFDPEIFAYSEDLDLALRLAVAGYATRLATEARVLHLGSATLGLGSPTQLRLAGFARGYVLGRYRVSAPWVLLELAVGLLVAVRARSVVPVVTRFNGWRRGRHLPARTAGRSAHSVSFTNGLRRRFASTRP